MNLLKNISKIMIMSICLFAIGFGKQTKPLELDPNHRLSLQEVYEVAYDHRKVTLTQSSLENIKRGHQIVMEAALLDKPVYGLTTGVGWNKDRPVFEEVGGKKILSKELLKLSKHFNTISLRAHGLGIGEPLSNEIVRASMLIRLNTITSGGTGVSLEVAKAYEDFINRDVTPVVPMNGSVGEADITLASHIGLAMIGEWKVSYQGKIYPSLEGLKKAGLKPIELVGKDFLSILSNNSITAARAVLSTLKAQKFYHQEIRLFALMLEGFNGNVAPFSQGAIGDSKFIGLQEASKEIRDTLKGSDLWKLSSQRALQDPLSYRTMNYALGNVYTSLQELQEALLIQINRNDDNPMVLLNAPKAEGSQLQSYDVKDGGAIYPTANFNFLPVVLKVESLNISLARLAENMTQQLIRISNPDFTKLPRFLNAPTNHGHGFGAIEKPFSQSNIMIKNLALPQSFHTVVLAGDIEDVASMGNLSVAHLGDIIEHLYEIAAFQLLEGTQSLDLRKGFVPGVSSAAIKNQYRKIVPFVSQDRIYSDAIKQSILFAKEL
ncbi:aromatic amino acid ammonia-lyase [Helicobacter sp. 11S03491-1]|uniref:HAL/PAL/TAL family ammonia-lyase n=1 Tax=Helicobacter sp. 11S03491-1 TaxID=1476196 RepID=UPI000BA50D6D|nr:aromatic amino acid ammonia-lyase [Helicobacter sp. 11S03491-1]PAF43429.1 hypothetical protein BKH45_02030 [Helicobacter sp. 11S03491-1]